MNNIVYLDQFRVKQPSIDDIVDDVTVSIITTLDDHGIDITGDTYMKDVALVIESVIAVVDRIDGRQHHLHSISNKINIGPRLANTAF